MKNLILILGIMGTNIFFSIMAIIGFNYQGVESSNIYVIYVILVAVLNIGLFVESVIRTKIKFNYRDFLILLVPLVYIISFLVSNIQLIELNRGAINTFNYFFIWAIPSILIGILVNKENRFDDLAKYIEIVMIVFTLGITISLLLNFIQGSNTITFGGATYQTASYVSAFAFGINMYFMFWGKNNKRFNFTKNRIYREIQRIMVIIQLLGVFISGGRGGLILLIVYFMYMTIQILSSRENKSKFKFIFLMISLLLLIIIFLPTLLENSFFEARFSRLFEYVSDEGGIDWSGTSNRNIIYEHATILISKKPLFGYGIFGYWNYIENPHNIILEVLLNGGLFYFLIFFFIMGIFLLKLKALGKINPTFNLLKILTIYPFVNLFFSGSYLVTAGFWFVISFVLTYKIEK